MELVKSEAIQLIAEIKHILKARENDLKTREFILGACYGIHTCIANGPEYITDEKIMSAVTHLLFDVAQYHKGDLTEHIKASKK